MKDQLTFDTTDANTIADSDNVGAFLRTSDGTLLTHTDVSGKKALDVRIAEGIDVGVSFSAADSSVESWLHDGTGTAITSTGGAIDVNIASGTLSINDAALADTAIASGATSLAVADTAQDIVASPLANRKYLHVYNNDNRKMYIGQTGVSSSTGFPVSPGAYMELRAGASIDIEFVSAKATHDLRYLELS